MLEPEIPPSNLQVPPLLKRKATGSCCQIWTLPVSLFFVRHCRRGLPPDTGSTFHRNRSALSMYSISPPSLKPTRTSAISNLHLPATTCEGYCLRTRCNDFGPYELFSHNYSPKRGCLRGGFPLCCYVCFFCFFFFLLIVLFFGVFVIYVICIGVLAVLFSSFV